MGWVGVEECQTKKKREKKKGGILINIVIIWSFQTNDKIAAQKWKQKRNSMKLDYFSKTKNKELLSFLFIFTLVPRNLS